MLTNITNIQYVKGVGEKRAQSLSRLGIDTVGVLLSFYPRAYKDLSKIELAYDAVFEEVVCIKAKIVTPIEEHYIRKNLTLYKFRVSDSSGIVGITIFNNKYLADRLNFGSTYLFYGKITGGFYVREISSPEIFEENYNCITPVYSATASVSSNYISKIIRNALENIEFEDILSDEIRGKYNLCDIKFALENIHFPRSEQSLQRARERLVFEELFLLQCGMQYLRSSNRGRTAAAMKRDYTDNFTMALPFTLTNAQLRCIKDCVYDMAKNVPMARLLQGDVGSGKTAVAAAVAFNAVKNGYQTILMAPTVILAEQHYNTFCSFLDRFGIKCTLLKSSLSKRDKKHIYNEIKEGRVDVIIGTHAVLNENLEYNNVGLVITDEQHRFGVAQRDALGKKGQSPHKLVMSATPIPRTLAMTIYGELDISIIDEYPKGRQKIETYSVTADYEKRVYKYIQKHLQEGKQGYIVCPLIEESENQHESVEKLFEQLSSGIFKNYRLGLLHGKMSSAEKEKVMLDFAMGTIQLLVCTTVVEVGIDVPNAAIIVIKDAELFGLSQLHQLRGRVGRGDHKSTCIMISKNQDSTNNDRLKVITGTNDGFKIAEEDLKLRGPGDFLGKRQHGLPELKIADFVSDYNVLKETRVLAKEILSNDKQLSLVQNKKLREKILNMFCI